MQATLAEYLLAASRFCGFFGQSSRELLPQEVARLLRKGDIEFIHVTSLFAIGVFISLFFKAV